MTLQTQTAAGPIDLLCQQLSRVTGWRMEYLPIEIARRDRSDERTRWTSQIVDGLDAVGELRLAFPTTTEPHVSYADAADIATAVASVVESLAQAQRRGESWNEDASTLMHLGAAMPFQDNVACVLSELLKGAVQLANARGAAFFLLDPALQVLRLRAVFRVEPAMIPQVCRNVAQSPPDLAALVRGPTVVPQGPERLAYMPNEMNAAICVPVQSETTPIGTLWVFDRRQRSFSPRDEEMLGSVASQIASAMERVALLRGSARHSRITRDLKQASQTQIVLMPTDLPPDKRYEIVAHWANCYEVGGDLCELIPLPNDKVGIAIGDAAGNSVQAALVMSAVRGALRTCVEQDLPVAEVVTRINSALYSIVQSNHFMTFCYSVFDPQRRTMEFCNAGHSESLLVRRGEVLPLGSQGLILGVLKEADYQSCIVQFEPGDLLVMYTDGISEARSGDDMFRSEGIIAAVRHCSGTSAGEVMKHIWSRVERHLGGVAGDDRTLLVMKIAG